MLEGRPFCFLGANNYYVTFKSRKMTDDVLEAAKAMSLRVLRVWAYIDKGSLDGAVASTDGPGDKDGVYFQYWDPVSGRPAYNDGASGLEHLDYVLEKARRLDLKVVLVLTNNWREFGGMDQYLMWYHLAHHHLFFTDARVRGVFKDWAAHLVGRTNHINGRLYRDDPTIFAWELANEPRTVNFGALDAPVGWTTQTIPAWADEMSSYLKAIDPHHLVAVGDEGIFAGGKDWGYDGTGGGDHRALVSLRAVDFSTFHLYPDTWVRTLAWSDRWIQDHLDLAESLGKPSVLEEYGVVAPRTPPRTGVLGDESLRDRAYRRWHELMEKRGGGGALFWMLAGRTDDGGPYPDYDGLAIHPNEAPAQLLREAATRFPVEAHACRARPGAELRVEGPRGPFVTVWRPRP